MDLGLFSILTLIFILTIEVGLIYMVSFKCFNKTYKYTKPYRSVKTYRKIKL